ncbi:hypothetical protein LJC55_04345, partial [Eubacteriales bacterium OttesenSCG-928-N14]|nr:hypothetical protein [Eubacteriales bacterium OttesenSCG-928-N14]
YYSRDNEFLITLPLRQRQVFLGKFIPEIVSEILTFALLVLPAMVVYGIKAGVAFGYWIKCLVVLFAGPMIPFGIACVLASLLVRVTVLVRHRDKLVMFGSFFFMIAYIVGAQLLGQSMNHLTSEDILALLSGGLMSMVGKIFPPAMWAAESLVYGGSSGLTSLALFVGVSALALVLTTIFAGNVFARGAIAQQEAAKKGKKVDLAKSSGKSSRMMSVFKREWKSIFRSPVYALNSLVGTLMGPMMLLIFAFTPVDDGETMDLLFQSLFQQGMGIYVMLGVVAIIYFSASMNMGAFTVYSREGKAIWLPLTLPISAKEQMNGKLLFGQSINILSVVLSGVACLLIMRMPILELLIACVSALVVGTLPLLIGVFVDMLKPKLDWINEQKAIKSNWVSAATMFGSWAILAVIGFGIYFMVSSLGIGMELAWVVVVTLSLIADIALYVIMIQKAPVLLQRMGEKI